MFICFASFSSKIFVFFSLIYCLEKSSPSLLSLNFAYGSWSWKFDIYIYSIIPIIIIFFFCFVPFLLEKLSLFHSNNDILLYSLNRVFNFAFYLVFKSTHNLFLVRLRSLIFFSIWMRNCPHTTYWRVDSSFNDCTAVSANIVRFFFLNVCIKVFEGSLFCSLRWCWKIMSVSQTLYSDSAIRNLHIWLGKPTIHLLQSYYSFFEFWKL